MKDILNAGLTFVILIVVLFIGGSIAVMTGSTVDNTLEDQNVNMSNYDWFTDTKEGAGNAMSTYAQFLPVIAIAVVGGIALFYVLNYLGMFGARE